MPDRLHNEWIDLDDESMDLDEYIRSIGYKSCKFIRYDYDIKSHWELSDEDYTWFMLRWGQ